MRQRAALLAVAAVLAVTAGGLPLAASASATWAAGTTAVGGDRAESDDEAEEYVGLFLPKVRAYEAFLTRESERADRTGGGVVVVPAEPAPDAGPAGWPVWSLGLAAMIGLLVGAALTAFSGRVRRPPGRRLTAA